MLKKRPSNPLSMFLRTFGALSICQLMSPVALSTTLDFCPSGEACMAESHASVIEITALVADSEYNQQQSSDVMY